MKRAARLEKSLRRNGSSWIHGLQIIPNISPHPPPTILLGTPCSPEPSTHPSKTSGRYPVSTPTSPNIRVNRSWCTCRRCCITLYCCSRQSDAVLSAREIQGILSIVGQGLLPSYNRATLRRNQHRNLYLKRKMPESGSSPDMLQMGMQGTHWQNHGRMEWRWKRRSGGGNGGRWRTMLA